MLPEFAVSYSVGLVPTSALTAVHLLLFRRKARSIEMQRVQKNLGRVGLFWADSESSICADSGNGWEWDQAKYRRSVLILGALCFFLSWLGFLAQLLVMVSLRYLALSRTEQKVFASSLAHADLQAHDVQALVEEWRALDPKSVAVPS